MRKLFGVAVCLLVSTAAFAQQDKPNGLFVFVSNPNWSYSTASGSHWDAEFGLALQRMFTPHVSGEVSVSYDSRTSRVVAFDSNGNLIGSRTITNRFTPVDLTARYHFFTDGAWKPYAGLGARVVDGQAIGGLTGGVVWQFRPALGLRFDAKVLLGNESHFTETFNGAVGLAWRF